MLFDRIQQRYGNMTKQQQRVADYLRAHPQDFIDLTSRELETRIGSSAATIVRFVQAMGYSSLNEMRVYVAQQIQHEENSVELMLRPTDDGASLEMKLMQLYRDAADSLRETLTGHDIDLAVAKLLAAKRIYLLGVGTSGLIAYDLYHRLNRYGKTTFYDTDPHMNLEFTAQSQADDVILAISYAGLTREVVLGAAAAHKRGVPVISILSDPDTPLGAATDIVLQVPHTEKIVRLSSVISRVHTTMVTDILFAGVMKDQLDSAHVSTVESNRLVMELKEDNE